MNDSDRPYSAQCAAQLDAAADRVIASVARAQGIAWPDDDDDE